MNGNAGRPGSVEQALRTNQILVLSLIMGVVIFMLVTTFVTLNGLRARSGIDANLLLGVLGALVISVPVASAVARGAIVGGLRKQADRGTAFENIVLARKLSALTIVRAALAEAPALLGMIITLITGNWLGFAGGAVGLVLLATVFPTRGKFESFVRDATGRMP